jgi:hypothetical protein
MVLTAALSPPRVSSFKHAVLTVFPEQLSVRVGHENRGTVKLRLEQPPTSKVTISVVGPNVNDNVAFFPDLAVIPGRVVFEAGDTVLVKTVSVVVDEDDFSDAQRIGKLTWQAKSDDSSIDGQKVFAFVQDYHVAGGLVDEIEMLSVPAKIALASAVIFVLYCVLGSFYRYKFSGAGWPEMVPHLVCWISCMRCSQGTCDKFVGLFTTGRFGASDGSSEYVPVTIMENA